MSRREVTGLCLLDLSLSAAVDTIDRSILIHRLQISSTRPLLDASYLRSRVFRVTTGNDTVSASFPLNCGVPQGSVLGTLLFIIYTTPLSHLIQTTMSSTTCAGHHLFQLYISFDSLSFEIAKLHIQSAITSISNWMAANFLTMNTDKTDFLIAKVVTNTLCREHISPVLKLLHWLPTKQGIIFKVITITQSPSQ